MPDAPPLQVPKAGEPAAGERLRRVLRLVAGGYLSKGYSQFSRSPLARTLDPEVRDDLLRLHPQRPPAWGPSTPLGGRAAVD